jgi:hypothetical protein|tara:strand:+ start:493 stop:831 length:339 start_codon:yes stop_codon:yes gene_type:complete
MTDGGRFRARDVQPSTVPESVLKKRKRDEQWASQKAAAAAEAKKAGEKKREEIFKRAEKYVKEYRDQVRDASERCDWARWDCLGFVGTSRDVARVARRPWDERDACWMRACD